MDKKDYLYLLLILLLGFIIRFWQQGLDVFNLATGLGAILAIFFLPIAFEGIKKGKNASLISAFLISISPFLINQNSSSLIFILSCFVLFFALSILAHKTKKGTNDYVNWFFLILSCAFLIYFNHYGAIFTLAVLLSVYLYKSKSALRHVAILPLLSPVIFYLLVKFNYINFYLNPINYETILFTFCDFFSFCTLNNNGAMTTTFYELVHNRLTLGIGFWAFIAAPFLIALVLILKNYFKPKNSHFFLLSTVLPTVLSILLLSLLNIIQFSANNLVEIYPILILLVSLGLFQMKSKSLKIIFITVFSVLNLFYLVASNFFPAVVFI